MRAFAPAPTARYRLPAAPASRYAVTGAFRDADRDDAVARGRARRSGSSAAADPSSAQLGLLSQRGRVSRCDRFVLSARDPMCLQLRLLLLQLAEQQAAQEVVLDGLGLAVLVVDHELREHLGDLLGDEPELERRVGVRGDVLVVAKGDRPQLEQAIGERAEVLDVLLDRARRGHRAELAGASMQDRDRIGIAVVTPRMPAMKVLVCVAWVPILMVAVSAAAPSLPMKMLSSPVVLR